MQIHMYRKEHISDFIYVFLCVLALAAFEIIGSLKYPTMVQFLLCVLIKFLTATSLNFGSKTICNEPFTYKQ